MMSKLCIVIINDNYITLNILCLNPKFYNNYNLFYKLKNKKYTYDIKTFFFYFRFYLLQIIYNFKIILMTKYMRNNKIIYNIYLFIFI
jgi:hypothetical protein